MRRRNWATTAADGAGWCRSPAARGSAGDGTVIGIVNTGVRQAAPEIARRMAAGEQVDPSLYYFRASPVFEVGPGPYAWLTSRLFVSAGDRLPDLVRLVVYEVS